MLLNADMLFSLSEKLNRMCENWFSRENAQMDIIGHECNEKK